jgi:hypothetical protein
MLHLTLNSGDSFTVPPEKAHPPTSSLMAASISWNALAISELLEDGRMGGSRLIGLKHLGVRWHPSADAFLLISQ